jgi:hypothetical protein
MRKIGWTAFGGLVAIALTTGQAFADHGKVGLWQVTTTVHTTGQAAMQRTFSSQHCMTAEEVKSTKIPESSDNKSCKLTDQHVNGNTLTAQMVCTGEAPGTGKMSVTYDSDKHYSGSLAMITKAGGQTFQMSNTFEGKWVSPKCGGVTH